MLRKNSRIVRKVAGEIAIRPTAAIFQRLGKIPVIHRAPGANSGGNKCVDEPAVVIDSLHIGSASAGRLYAGPRDGETVALQVQGFGQCDVLRVKMILIARDIAVHATPDLARCMREPVPDRFAFAVFVPRTFHLIGSRGCAPEEIVGEMGFFNGRGRSKFRRMNRPRCRNSSLIEKRGADGSQGIGHELPTLHRSSPKSAKSRLSYFATSITP